MPQPAPPPRTPTKKRGEDPVLGKVIAGRYRLEARIGEGGMGIVYRARHVLIDRVVAVKLIRPDLRGETHLRAWMLREARAANRVDHAHIIDIHDIGETDEGELYLVMEYLVGTALSARCAGPDAHRSRRGHPRADGGGARPRARPRRRAPRPEERQHPAHDARRPEDFVKILDFGLAALAHDPRLAPRGRCSARRSTCRPSRRAASRRAPSLTCTPWACSSSRC
jgi:serine/threonine-protein kinase